jgi:hypothetical protein
MKKIVLGLVLAALFTGNANAFFKKDVKAYLCNYQEGVLINPDLGRAGDPCMEGGPSKYKFYLGGKFKAKEEDDCRDFIDEYSNTAEMIRKYPTNAWMIGCDSNWK